MKNFIFSVNNAGDIFSVKSYEKNSVIIVATRYNADGTKTNNVLTVPGLKKHDPVAVVKHLLRCIIAESRMIADFNDDYGTYCNDYDESKKTGIRCRRLFGSYLQSNTIFRTDADGKLIAVLTVTDGKLSQTALNVTASQAIATEQYNSNCFRSLVHNQAKAIVEQCEWVKNVDAEITAIDDAAKQPEQTATEQPEQTATEQPEQIADAA